MCIFKVYVYIPSFQYKNRACIQILKAKVCTEQYVDVYKDMKTVCLGDFMSGFGSLVHMYCRVGCHMDGRRHYFNTVNNLDNCPSSTQNSSL